MSVVLCCVGCEDKEQQQANSCMVVRSFSVDGGVCMECSFVFVGATKTKEGDMSYVFFINIVG